jgi:hypothetical protein
MAPIVSLQAVVDEMDVLSDETYAYLNTQTGELVTIRREEIAIVEDSDDLEDAIAAYPAWQHDLIRKTKEVLDSEDYLPLPSTFDIHEYAIIERFCYAIEDEEFSQDLLDQIRGRGAFRRFKDAIHRHGIADDWYHFRQAALEEIAMAWLEAQSIPYTRKEA